MLTIYKKHYFLSFIRLFKLSVFIFLILGRIEVIAQDTNKQTKVLMCKLVIKNSSLNSKISVQLERNGKLANPKILTTGTIGKLDLPIGTQPGEAVNVELVQPDNEKYVLSKKSIIVPYNFSEVILIKLVSNQKDVNQQKTNMALVEELLQKIVEKQADTQLMAKINFYTLEEKVLGDNKESIISKVAFEYGVPQKKISQLIEYGKNSTPDKYLFVLRDLFEDKYWDAIRKLESLLKSEKLKKLEQANTHYLLALLYFTQRYDVRFSENIQTAYKLNPTDQAISFYLEISKINKALFYNDTKLIYSSLDNLFNKASNYIYQYKCYLVTESVLLQLNEVCNKFKFENCDGILRNSLKNYYTDDEIKEKIIENKDEQLLLDFYYKKFVISSLNLGIAVKNDKLTDYRKHLEMSVSFIKQVREHDLKGEYKRCYFIFDLVEKIAEIEEEVKSDEKNGKLSSRSILYDNILDYITNPNFLIYYINFKEQKKVVSNEQELVAYFNTKKGKNLVAYNYDYDSIKVLSKLASDNSKNVLIRWQIYGVLEDLYVGIFQKVAPSESEKDSILHLLRFITANDYLGNLSITEQHTCLYISILYYAKLLVSVELENQTKEILFLDDLKLCLRKLETIYSEMGIIGEIGEMEEILRVMVKINKVSRNSKDKILNLYYNYLKYKTQTTTNEIDFFTDLAIKNNSLAISEDYFSINDYVEEKINDEKEGLIFEVLVEKNTFTQKDITYLNMCVEQYLVNLRKILHEKLTYLHKKFKKGN